MKPSKTLIIDLDGTITLDDNLPYTDKRPNLPLVKKLKAYKKQGFKIVIFTSRAMRTFGGDIEQIRANALPTILAWLKKHKIPFDEVIVGKPWCGERGFYIDDRAVRPSEFANLNFSEITQLLEREKSVNLAQNTQDSLDSLDLAPQDSLDSRDLTPQDSQDSAVDSPPKDAK